MTDAEFIAWLHRQGKPETKAQERWKYGDPAGFVKFASEKGESMLRRVRKEDVQRDGMFKEDPLTTCLIYWAAWMGKPDLDIGTQLGCDGHSGCANPHQRRETEIAEAVDAMINGLKPCDRWAIYHRCGISTQWRFPQLDFTVVLPHAEGALTEKLKKNVATRSLF